MFDILAVGGIDADLVLTVDHLPSSDEKVIDTFVGQKAGGPTAIRACAASRLGLRVAALTVTTEHKAEIQALPVPVADTISVGDPFNATFLTFGGNRTLSESGASPGILSAREGCARHTKHACRSTCNPWQHPNAAQGSFAL